MIEGKVVRIARVLQCSIRYSTSLHCLSYFVTISNQLALHHQLNIEQTPKPNESNRYPRSSAAD